MKIILIITDESLTNLVTVQNTSDILIEMKGV